MAVEVQYRGDNSDTGPSDGVWFDVDPLAAPKKQVEIFEDFVGISGLDLVATTTVLSIVGGGVDLVAADDAVVSKFAFLLADGKDLTFEARVLPDDAATFRCGLEDADASDRITFEVAANSAVLHHDNGSSDDTIATKAITAASWVKLGFRVRGSGDNTEFTGYVDGVKVATTNLGDMAATSVAATIMKLSVICTGTPDVQVDWIKAVQLR